MNNVHAGNTGTGMGPDKPVAIVEDIVRSCHCPSYNTSMVASYISKAMES
jgi:hypothetical protein